MENEYLLYWLFGAVIGIIILYFTIKLAVQAAMSEHSKQTRALTRLTVKKMLKEGWTRHEIVEIIGDYEVDFWNRIP